MIGKKLTEMKINVLSILFTTDANVNDFIQILIGQIYHNL